MAEPPNAGEQVDMATPTGYSGLLGLKQPAVIALNGTNTTIPEPPPFELPFREELAEGIAFSRRFVLSYNILLFSILLLLILKHRYCRRTYLKTDPDLQGTPHEPLLRTHRLPHPLLLRIRGILAYQPPNILGFETSPVSTLLVLAAYYALNLFYIFYNVHFHRLKYYILAHRVGCMFTANLPLLYLLAAKLPILRYLTGWTYSRINILHRAAGRVCVLAITGHVFGFIYVWWATLQANITLNDYLWIPQIACGLVAYICYCILSATSLEWFRARCYEVFLAAHVGLQTMGLVLLWIHHWNARVYVLVSLIIFLGDRVWYRLIRASVPMTGTAKVIDDETLFLSLTPPKGYTWTPGDHVFFCIPALEILHPHPFSVVNIPTDGGNLDFLVRARDGFSRRLLQDVAQHGEKSVRAVVDGPYGCDEAHNCIRKSEVIVGIAGGSGVAVIYPILLDAAQQYSRNKRIVFVWIVREEKAAQTWLPPASVEKLKSLGVSVRIFITTDAPRPDINALLFNLGFSRETMGVLVCGPNTMVRDTRNSAARLARHGFDTHIVTEKFGW